MEKSGWRPMLTIQVTPEQYRNLQKLIPWGARRRLFSSIIDQLVDIVSHGGEASIVAIIEGKIRLGVDIDEAK